jgi:hypothetical protein
VNQVTEEVTFEETRSYMTDTEGEPAAPDEEKPDEEKPDEEPEGGEPAADEE